MSRFDNELDKNGDNLLSKEEILAWIIPSNEEIATEEVGLSCLKKHILKHIKNHICLHLLLYHYTYCPVSLR